MQGDVATVDGIRQLSYSSGRPVTWHSLLAHFLFWFSCHSHTIRYDTIYYLHWKTDRQAASL